MKTFYLTLLGAGLVLIGCSDKSSPPAPNTSSGNPLTAPVDYLNAAAKAEQHAIKTVDVAAISKAIEMFQVDKGRFPKDLNELVTEKFMPKLPEPPAGSKIDYDPKTGTVKVVKL